MEDEIFNGMFDPLIRTAGATAISASAIYAGYYKVRQTLFGKSPTDTAIDSILPQAFTRAVLAMQDGQHAVESELRSASAIDELKDQLNRAKTREEKLRLWTEITVQSYTITLVAPHIYSTLAITLAIRSAVGVLAHLQLSAGMHMDSNGKIVGKESSSADRAEKKNFIKTFASSLFSAGAKTALTSAMMSHLTNLLGTNAFAVDDADSANAQSAGNSRNPESFGHNDIIDLLCSKVPLLMRKASLCVKEQLGMLAADALPSVHQVTKGNVSSSRGSTFSAERKEYKGSLVDITQRAPLKFVEDAIWAAHLEFFDYVLDWQGDVFGSSPMLFPELASRGPSLSDEGSEDRSVESDIQQVPPSHSSPSSGEFGGSAAFSFQSAVDPILAHNYRRMTRRYMQDLLTYPDVDTMLRSFGEENFAYWWKVLFFQANVADGLVLTAAETNEEENSEAELLRAKNERAKRACSSYDEVTTTVRLVEFSLYVDKARQQLFLYPLYTSNNAILAIPAPVKTFCEELLRASGPK